MTALVGLFILSFLVGIPVLIWIVIARNVTDMARRDPNRVPHRPPVTYRYDEPENYREYKIAHNARYGKSEGDDLDN